MFKVGDWVVVTNNDNYPRAKTQTLPPIGAMGQIVIKDNAPDLNLFIVFLGGYNNGNIEGEHIGWWMRPKDVEKWEPEDET